MLAILSDLRRHGRINLGAHYPGSNAFLDLIHVPEHGERGDHILSEGTLLHRQLIDSDPDAYFILNTRNVEHWIASRCRHLNGSFLEIYRRHLSRISAGSLGWTTCCRNGGDVASGPRRNPDPVPTGTAAAWAGVRHRTHALQTLKDFLAPDYNLVGDALPRSGNGCHALRSPAAAVVSRPKTAGTSSSKPLACMGPGTRKTWSRALA